MNIFTNMAQAARFAFTLEQYPGEPGAAPGSMVRMALNEAGVVLRPDVWARVTPADVRDYADQITSTIKVDLLAYESASLIAAFSRNWEERRRAVETLAGFHSQLILGTVNDRKVVNKLVARHYIAERERGAPWALGSIADEFKVARERVTTAANRIEESARKLEAIALAVLQRALDEKREPVHA